MFITVRVSLQPETTKEQATIIGNQIAILIQESNKKDFYRVHKVYFSVQDGDGDYLGP